MLAVLLPLLVAQDVADTVVEAPRAAFVRTSSGFSAQTVTAEDLARTGERSLPRMLAKAAGIFVQETNLGGGSPIVNGLAGSQVLLVVDGVRMNDSTTRDGVNQMLNGVDPATVERIDILRGPSSVLYGSDAVGGAILIWTKSRKPEAAKDASSMLRGELDGQYQSVNQGWRGSAGVSATWEDDALIAIGSLQDWEDLRSGSGTVDHTGYHGQAWFGAWEHALSARRHLRLSASRTRDFDIPRTDRMNVGFGQTQPADAEHFFTLQDRERYLLAFSDLDGGISDEMQVRLSLRKYVEERRILATGSSTRRFERDDTETVGLGADWRKAIGDEHLLTWGFDADFDDVDSTRTNVDVNTGASSSAPGAFAPESQYLSTGVFVQDEILAFEPLDVTVGLRYSHFEFGFENNVAFSPPATGPAVGEDVEGDFDALTGSLQVARDVSEGVRISASLGQAFRAPNLAVLARNATFAAGNELPNDDLEPEISLYEELALDLTRGRWRASFSLFHNQLDDTIGRRLISDPTPANPVSGDELYQRVNAGDAEYFGGGARARCRLGRDDSPYAFEVYVEYVEGELHDTIDPLTGAAISQAPASKVPPLHGYLAMLYQPVQPTWRVSWAEVSLWWATEQDELSPFDLTDPRIDPDGTQGWMRVDLDLGGPLGRSPANVEWRIGVHNLFDQSYRVHASGFDAPGLGLVVGIRAAF